MSGKYSEIGIKLGIKTFKLYPAFLSIFFIFILVIPTLGQYQLKQSSFGNGGIAVNSTAYNVQSTLGQTFIGSSQNSFFVYRIGFWTYTTLLTGIAGEDILLPKKFELMQNYPNPFNPVTNIKYAVPKLTHIMVEVYNVLGQRIKTLVNEEKQAGYYIIDFDASNLASGFYIYRLESGSRFNAVKKMIVTK